MSSESDRIIHGFGERLAIDKAVRAMGDAPDRFGLEEQARALARRGAAVVPALLRHLDTDNATLRGGLGLLAQHLGAELVAPALKRAATDTRRSNQARLTAVMILERYLGETLPPELVRRLPDPASVARQSALEALALAESNPAVLLDYASQLLEEPDEVVESVVNVIAGLDNPRRARLLAIIACYAPVEIAAHIVGLLGRMREADALMSLRVLSHLMDERLRAAAARQARKLQLAGVRLESDSRLRALWSPINAQGLSLLWFIRHIDGAESARLMQLVLADMSAVAWVEAQPVVPLQRLPFPSSFGHRHLVQAYGGSERIPLIELPPEFGLRLLDEALVGEWEASAGDETIHSEARDVLALYGDWLWRDQPRRSAHDHFAQTPKPADDAPSSAFENLFTHQAFAGWVWDSDLFVDMVETLPKGHVLREHGVEHQEAAARLVAHERGEQLAQRLLWQARWLAAAGDADAAALTLAASEASRLRDASHPFIRALAWISLLTAIAAFASQRVLSELQVEVQTR
ncbi:MAG: hypothetical protein GXP42_17540 [Chloroflexi bacterium]|nr:hypothetical protein [Chloroflexota bacterium]